MFLIHLIVVYFYIDEIDDVLNAIDNILSNIFGMIV
jgi:hypothetical protein